MLQALKGVRVVDMSHVIAGPLASFYLAQLGAEVIKIESPEGGDVLRGPRTAPTDTPDGFVALNAGKHSVAVDVRTPEGAQAVRDLARTADVFIENFRPGVVKRFGLDEPAIRAVNPGVVYCSISGFGQQGEWSGRGAYDHVVQALTGMMMMSGEDPQGPPVKVGFPVVDVAVGLLAAMAISAALHQRARDGQGQTIDASMVQAALMLMYPNVSAFLSSGVEPQRIGNRGYSGSPTADTYRCLDGWLSTAANTPAQFRKLAQVLGLESLCEDGRALDLDAFNSDGGFVVARDVPYLRAQFAQAFAQRSAAEMEERLNAVGVPAARVRKLGEFLREVQDGAKLPLPAMQFEQGERTVRTAGLGFRPGGAAAAGPRPGAESLGASTRRLLEEAAPRGENMFPALVLEKSPEFSASVREVDDGFLPEAAVTVAIDYSTINYKDALAITNRSPVVRSWPMVAGIDGSGSVVDSSDPRWKPGDPVILNGFGVGETHKGCLAGKARLKGDWLVRRPAAFSARQAMAIGTAGYTAMLCVLALERHGLRPDDGEVLVTGATGGVGSVAIAVLAQLGYRVVAATGKASEGDYLRKLGAAAVIDRAELAAPGKPLQKERWAGVVDAVGSHTLANACAQVRYGGAVAACGLAQGMDLPATVAPFILRAVALLGVDSVMAPMHLREQAWLRLARDLDPALLETMTTEIPLAQAVEAAQRLMAGQVRGRIVVKT